MSNSKHKIPQGSLILRLLCAGYLLYTAWDIREAFQDGIHFVIFAIVFAAVGLVLGIHSLRCLIRQEFLAKPAAPAAEDEEIKDCEEQSDE